MSDVGNELHAGPPPPALEGSSSPQRILVVDDEPDLLRFYGRALAKRGREIELVNSGQLALEQLQKKVWDAIVSDIRMPGIDGMQLLAAVREVDKDVSVILVTGSPTIETATRAFDHAAFRYLTKPLAMETLCTTVDSAIEHTAAARHSRQIQTSAKTRLDVQTGLRVRYEGAVQKLWMAYQPVIRWSTQRVMAWEALLRTREETMRNPFVFLSAADALGETRSLSRAVRAAVAAQGAPAGQLLFVNLVPADLADEELHSPDSPLTKYASQVVLEVTERASLDKLPDLARHLASLRSLGYRLALDDMGEGYAGLNSVALVEPEVMKLDMSLVRGLDTSSTRQHLVRSMLELGGKLGSLVLAEGVETTGELETLLALGCDYFQGYLFARPGPPFPEVVFPTVGPPKVAT